MSALHFVLARPVLVAFAEALLHFLWQGALIALVLRAALDLAQSPRVRYAAACTALLAMVGAPVVTTIVLAPSAQAAGHMPFALPRPAIREALLAAVPWAWSIGAAAMLLRVAVGAAIVRRLRRRSVPLPRAWQGRVDHLARTLGVARRVAIAACEEVGAPIVVGIMRPLILVPPAILVGMAPRAFEAILAHELAHVARFDVLASALASIAESLLFYHPAVAWVGRTIRAEREHAADDLAAAVVGDRLVYAHALADLEARRAGPTFLATASNGGSLVKRIQRLAIPVVPSRRVALPLLAALALAVALGLAAACGSRHEAEAIRVAWLPASVARYAPEIAVAAERHGVDPELLAIVMFMESKGDPAVVSPGGAVGLMQVMPATAAAIAIERGLPAPTAAKLLDPAYNLDLGAYYLGRQLERFGSVDLAAAAYNGGPSCVDAFLARGAPLGDETSRYRERVSRLYAARREADEPR